MNLHEMLSPVGDAAPASVCPPSPASSVNSSTSSIASSITSITSSSAASSECSADVDALKPGWVAPFLLHLHQMLRRENPKIIRWTDDGVAFQILDKVAMTEQILPRYFKNKNFASFQRQLNYFGFRKWSKARAQHSTYSREHFTRDDYGAMSLVKRQSKKSRKRPASGSAGDEQEAKRATPASAWVAADKCKPILPRPGAVVGTASNACSSESTLAAVSPSVSALPTPSLESFSPLTKPWAAPSSGLFVHAPSPSTPLFSLPVISPTRKVASGCKLPSIHDLAFGSALSSSNSVGARPCWLA